MCFYDIFPFILLNRRGLVCCLKTGENTHKYISKCFSLWIFFVCLLLSYEFGGERLLQDAKHYASLLLVILAKYWILFLGFRIANVCIIIWFHFEIFTGWFNSRQSMLLHLFPFLIFYLFYRCLSVFHIRSPFFAPSSSTFSFFLSLSLSLN